MGRDASDIRPDNPVFGRIWQLDIVMYGYTRNLTELKLSWILEELEKTVKAKKYHWKNTLYVMW